MAQSVSAFYRVWVTADLRREIFSYLGYVEALALSRALRPRIDCRGSLPDFRSSVQERLPFPGSWPQFWQALQQAGGLIHGSFLLHCLLAPIGQRGHDHIFAPDSDVDLLLPNGADSKPLEQLLESLGWQCDETPRTSASMYTRRWYWIPGSGGEVAYDEVSIDLPPGKTVFDWIRVEQDFDFCKVAYDGRRLVIFDPKALVRRRTPFPMPGSTCGLVAMRYRTERYREKGFVIDVPPEVQKLFDEEDARRERHRRSSGRRQRYIRGTDCGCCG